MIEFQYHKNVYRIKVDSRNNSTDSIQDNVWLNSIKPDY